jgi:hypothetical protein
MSDASRTIIVQASPPNEALDLMVGLREFHDPELPLAESETKAFSGAEFKEIVVSLSPSVSVAALAGVLRTWIRAKEHRVIRMNGLELRGYSVREVEELVEKVFHKLTKNRPTKG